MSDMLYVLYFSVMYIVHCCTGNIDQVQYCDKVKNITDFLGMKLSKEELTKIWKMQVSHVKFVCCSNECDI